MFAQQSEQSKRIYYEVYGQGPLSINASRSEKNKPVLFLVHGGPGLDCSSYREHSLDLSKWAQLVLFDLSGHGKSSGDPSKHTLEDAIEDVEYLRRHLNLDKFCILGFSYGGFVALGYVCKYPQSLDGLILVSTAYSYHFIAESIIEFRKLKLSEDQIAIFERLCSGNLQDRKDFEIYFKQLAPLYSSSKIDENKSSQSTWDDVQLQYKASNAAYASHFWHFDFSSELSKITCSTLLLSGKADWMCPASFSLHMAQAIPNAKHLNINCGHLIPIDANDTYISAIQAFLTQQPDSTHG